MQINMTRVKNALVLTPAVYMLASWIYLVSPLATPDMHLRILSLALLMAFGVAFSITLYVSAVKAKSD
jgi:hypothetical protein